ncbi:MAG: TolC family protein [bacterium]
MKITRQIPKLALTFLLAGLPGNAFVQNQTTRDAMVPANLDKMIHLAIERNPAIKAAESRYRAYATIPKQVSTLPDPILGYTRWSSSVETRVGPQENVFALSQRIPFPGKLGLKGKMAGQDAEAVQYGYDATKRDVVFKIKSTYADLYRIDQSLAILDAYQSLLRDFSTVAATKYATGQGIQAQVLKADVEISSISAKKLDFEKMRTGVVARLNALTDMPANSSIGIAAEIDTTRLRNDEQALTARALSKRQELLANQAMIEKAGYMRKLAKKNYWPDFNVQATYVTIPKVNDQFVDSGRDPFSVMVGLNLPIWFGKRSAAVEQAEETRAAQQLMYENLYNMVEAEIMDIVFQLKTIEETLLLYEQGLLIQAESSLESATSAYKTGNLDFLNLLDAERMLLQLRLAYIGEQANHYKQIAALERAIGGNL